MYIDMPITTFSNHYRIYEYTKHYWLSVEFSVFLRSNVSNNEYSLLAVLVLIVAEYLYNGDIQLNNY